MFINQTNNFFINRLTAVCTAQCTFLCEHRNLKTSGSKLIARQTLWKFFWNSLYMTYCCCDLSGHSNQTASDWQWLHNYGNLLRTTDALAIRSSLPSNVFHMSDKDRSFQYSTRHPLVCMINRTVGERQVKFMMHMA